MIAGEAESPPRGKPGSIVGSSAGKQMIWVITVATFLGTVLVVVIVFLVFSQRKQIREALKKLEEQ